MVYVKISISLVVAVLLFSAVLFFRNDKQLTIDERVVTAFANNGQRLSNFVNYARTKRKLVEISSSSYGNEMSKEERVYLQSFLKSLNADSIRILPEPFCVHITLGARGLAVSGSSWGIMYDEAKPTPLVSKLAESRTTGSGEAYIHLSDYWYGYYSWDD